LVISLTTTRVENSSIGGGEEAGHADQHKGGRVRHQLRAQKPP